LADLKSRLLLAQKRQTRVDLKFTLVMYLAVEKYSRTHHL